MSKSLFPRMDPDVLKLLKQFGGWQRVLDPSFSPPEELYAGFEAAGYSRERLDKMRAFEGRTERDAWTDTIARCFYDWWRASYNIPYTHHHASWPGYPGKTPGIRWQDYPNEGAGWEMFKDEMTRLSISKEDVDTWIESHSESFPPLGSNEA